MKEPVLEKVLRRFRLKKIDRHIEIGDRILDLGCGWESKVLKHYASKISMGYGIDFKVEDIELPSNIRVYSHHFQNRPWPIESEKVHKVVMLAVLEHIDPKDLANIFSGIHQILVETGRLLLTVPTPASKPVLEFLAYRLGVINADEIRDHKIYYNHSLLEKMLNDFDFEIESYRKFQFGFNSFCVAKKKSPSS